MKPYNKINNKMENFFIKKTSFSEPSADSLNSEIRIFEEFLIVGVNKSDFEKKVQAEDARIKLMYAKLIMMFIVFDFSRQRGFQFTV